MSLAGVGARTVTEEDISVTRVPSRALWGCFWVLTLGVFGGLFVCVKVDLKEGVSVTLPFATFGSSPMDRSEASVDDDGGLAAERARELVGVPPHGYRPASSQRVAEDFEVIMFQGLEPKHRGLFVFARSGASDQASRARRFFDSSDAGVEALAESTLNVSADNIVARGLTQTGTGLSIGYAVIYGTAFVRRDALNFGQFRDGRPDRTPMLFSLLSFECPGDDAVRLGVWTRRQTLEQGVDPATLTRPALRGTVGDEAELAKLVAGLTPCRDERRDPGRDAGGAAED